jgi:hypothetical protein
MRAFFECVSKNMSISHFSASAATPPSINDEYKSSLDALKGPVRAMLPPLNTRPSEEGMHYYLRYVQELSNTLYPVRDVFGLVDQIKAIEWVIGLLSRPDGQTYARERRIDPNVVAQALRWARYMASQQLMSLASEGL